jgi:hypothetical protein
VIVVYGFFRFKHERCPMGDIRTADVTSSYLYLESSYGLERVSDFRYNSRQESRFVLLSERIGFWWMLIGCLSR